MNECYAPAAYRSDAIPNLPGGGHRGLDKAFERLSWGHSRMQIVPNTMEAQLAYAALFKQNKDAEDGFPWGEEVFSVSKGFLSGLQGLLYIIYMCSVVFFFIQLGITVILLLIWISEGPSLEGLIFFYNAQKYFYLIVGVGYFGGKYGRLLLAYLTQKRQRANPTGLYRREGLVRIKNRRSVFEARFIEFDAYLVHIPSGRGGRYYNLLLQHRYSDHKLWMEGLLTDAMNPKEVYAYWDMIQQFMDVTKPLPDLPIFEPFRHRDPITAAHDCRIERDPFKWRKMTPEFWRKNLHGRYTRQLQETNFTQSCILDAHIKGRGRPAPDNPEGVMLA
ncbi:hypothetical protein [Marinobacter sp. bablab_jr008]|uniref:hypothetical protein n=1 Tax=Marinobacter sp. bablab_jr008 TaxID=2755064 RepID=UPI0018F14085|nr:hypothetical protein [Marinobacter sp. bablab_jr008]